MDIEWLRNTCLSRPATSEDIKWGNDLCFLVAGKMFCVAGLDQPLTISFKVPNELFPEISGSEGYVPAPYMARASWVQLTDATKVRKEDLEKQITRSYELVKARLPKKVKVEFGLT